MGFFKKQPKKGDSSLVLDDLPKPRRPSAYSANPAMEFHIAASTLTSPLVVPGGKERYNDVSLPPQETSEKDRYNDVSLPPQETRRKSVAKRKSITETPFAAKLLNSKNPSNNSMKNQYSTTLIASMTAVPLIHTALSIPWTN